MSAFTHNPFSRTFDFESTGSGSGTIPQFNTDPVSPPPNYTWVLKTSTVVGGGIPIGLLLGLTYSGVVSNSYQLSYKTLEGPIVRVALT